MMLDYLKLSMDGSIVSPKIQEYFHKNQDMVMCVSSTGEIKWKSPVCKAVRSDTHQIMSMLGSRLDIWGSPARCMGNGKSNVFGSFNIMECFHAMTRFVSEQTGGVLPWDPEIWKVRRVDITGNFHLGNLNTVKQALNYLRHSEGGRYQVQTQAESVYWSKKSRLRAGKAYAKGPHMEYMVRKGKAELSKHELGLVQSLLRLELKLGSTFWSRTATKPWFEYTSEDFLQIYTEYFKQFIGAVEVTEMTDILNQLEQIADTKGQAQAAYKTWLLVQQHGQEMAKSLTNKATWYRHRAMLKAVGISYADMHEGKIVPFRRRTIVLGDPVTNWNDLEQRCA